MKERRWKGVALLATGMAIGVVLVATPAGAHVSSWTHNWNKHIKPMADKRYQRIPATPQHYTIAGSALVPANGSRADVLITGSGDQMLGWCYGGGGDFYAEVHLPRGARVTGFAVDYGDDAGGGGGNGTVYLTRMPFKGHGGTYQDIFAAGLDNTPVPGDTATKVGSLFNASAQTVDNAHVYNVIGQGVAAGAAVCGIDIKYTVKAPFTVARVAPQAGRPSSRP